jgi:hypothetical protein
MGISNVLVEQSIGATADLLRLSAGKTSTSGIPATTWIPVIAAVIAAAAAVGSAFLQRKTGREATAAAPTRAEASGRSARAAEEAVEVNRSTASATGIRADAAALAGRYQDAASQLGHDKAAVRLAGVYAMSRLADDWPKEQQTCIDVLCAYLRLPWQETREPIESKPVGDEAQVRRTIASVINRHVAEDAEISWAANDFDFSGAELTDFVLVGCVFTGRVTFSGAHFIGECVLDDIAFERGASFLACAILGHMRLDDIRASEGWQIEFTGARVAAEAELEISTNTKEPKNLRQWLNFQSMVIQGTLRILHNSSIFKQAPLNLNRMELDGGRVEIIRTVSLTKDPRPRYLHKIDARDWKISTGSQILIPQDFIADDTVSWGSTFGDPVIIPDGVEISFNVPKLDP